MYTHQYTPYVDHIIHTNTHTHTYSTRASNLGGLVPVFILISANYNIMVISYQSFFYNRWQINRWRQIDEKLASLSLFPITEIHYRSQLYTYIRNSKEWTRSLCVHNDRILLKSNSIGATLIDHTSQVHIYTSTQVAIYTSAMVMGDAVFRSFLFLTTLSFLLHMGMISLHSSAAHILASNWSLWSPTYISALKIVKFV